MLQAVKNIQYLLQIICLHHVLQLHGRNGKILNIVKFSARRYPPPLHYVGRAVFRNICCKQTAGNTAQMLGPSA
jgi:hypothetical protein